MSAGSTSRLRGRGGATPRRSAAGGGGCARPWAFVALGLLGGCAGDESGSASGSSGSTVSATVASAATDGESSITESSGSGSDTSTGSGGGPTSTGTTGTSGTTGTTGTGASTSTSAGESESEASTTSEGLVPGLIAVGYGGIRVVSRDLGQSWGDRESFAADGVDDQDLLRAITYGDGLWVATGWRYVTSTDGLEWTDHGLLNENEEIGIPCNIVEGLAFAGGYFYAACTDWEGVGRIYRSADGLTYEPWSMIDDPGGHLFLTYRGGVFVAYGDHGTSYVADDATRWSVMPDLVNATYCEDTWRSEVDCYGASWFEGAYLRGEWSNRILRSTDGLEWTTVYEDVDEDNVPYRARAIAAGMVAPAG